MPYPYKKKCIICEETIKLSDTDVKYPDLCWECNRLQSSPTQESQMSSLLRVSAWTFTALMIFGSIFALLAALNV